MMNRNRLIRDDRSKAVLNTDLEALNKYKKEREQTRKLEFLFNEMKQVKEELNHIRSIIEKNC